MDESARMRENEWFLQHEARLLEDARKARETRETERREREGEEERRRLKDQHFMKCPKCGHDLRAENLEGIEIDRCTFCEGFFMDAGELEELFQKKQPERQGFMRWLLRI